MSECTVQCPFCPKRAANKDDLGRHMAQRTSCRDALARLLAATSAQARERIAALTVPADEEAGFELDRPAEEEDDEPDRNIDVDSAGPFFGGPPSRSPSPPGRAEPAAKRVRVSDELNSMDERSARFVEAFPGPAGQPIGIGESRCERRRREVKEAGHGRWWPFKSEDEWRLAEFMLKKLSQADIKEYLELELVHASSPPLHLLSHCNDAPFSLLIVSS
jgi:hypothetical protein